jgi:phage terminase large subunit-like protein
MRKTYAEKLRNVLNASIANGRLSEVLNELSAAELEFIAHDWQLWARDEQLCPALGGRLDEGESPSANKNWRVWLLLGGRGSGKTRAGAEWVRSLALAPDDSPAGSRPSGADIRVALVGKTLADVRNVMIEGQSGLLAIHPARERPLFEPSKRRLT